MTRLRNWSAILEHAAEIVASYNTGVTLRQLFYRLVSDGTIQNRQSEYKQLSSRTAEARRAGTFPALVDNTRVVHRPACFASPADVLEWTSQIYRRDRTEGQDWNVYIGVEKDGLTALLRDWFEDYGVRVAALRGFASQTFVDRIVEDVETDGRPAVLIYGGDFDPSGEAIQRDFAGRSACWREVVRVALTPEQIKKYNLPELRGKATDTRARKFMARHGELVQVEIDALPPDVLRGLYEAAFSDFFDMSRYREVLEAEDEERVRLCALAKSEQEGGAPAIPADSASEPRALAWLRSRLAGGPAALDDLKVQADSDGLRWREVTGARRLLPVRVKRHGERWTWTLRESAEVLQ
jgi:hypothetical protein